MQEPMSIRTLNGSKVKVTEWSAENGRSGDVEQVSRLLTIGQQYTIDYLIVHGSYTEVFLKEFGSDESFNSVNFVNIPIAEWDK